MSAALNWPSWSKSARCIAGNAEMSAANSTRASSPSSAAASRRRGRLLGSPPAGIVSPRLAPVVSPSMSRPSTEKCSVPHRLYLNLAASRYLEEPILADNSATIGMDRQISVNTSLLSCRSDLPARSPKMDVSPRLPALPNGYLPRVRFTRPPLAIRRKGVGTSTGHPKGTVDPFWIGGGKTGADQKICIRHNLRILEADVGPRCSP